MKKFLLMFRLLKWIWKWVLPPVQAVQKIFRRK